MSFSTKCVKSNKTCKLAAETRFSLKTEKTYGRVEAVQLLNDLVTGIVFTHGHVGADGHTAILQN